MARTTSKRPSAKTGSLGEYRAKRDFSKTPEPAAGRRKKAGTELSFVIQKHAARRLHYDFRLELDGVLKSWAVARGPSPNPSDKRLAIHTEDHPMDYGGFEGVIPKGQYGGGTVMLWDRGTWEPEGDPRRGHAEGKLKFLLHGERLAGLWTLVRMGGRAGREKADNWLLIKDRDAAAIDGDGVRWLDEHASSIDTGRTMDEIAADQDRVWSSTGGEEPEKPQEKAGKARRKAPAGGRKAALPDFVTPQLATLVTAAPSGKDWLHEIKFDGYRLLCRIDDGEVRLLTRNRQDWTDRFKDIAMAAADLPVTMALIDGEAVVLDQNGVSDFGALQAVLSGEREAPISYFAFDLLHLDGKDVTGLPLEDRKQLLEPLLEGFAEQGGPILYSDHQPGSGVAFYQVACRFALEGAVSKRRDAPYRPGRGPDWVKTKCLNREDFVIGGFSRPTKGGPGLRSLLLGYWRDGDLVYAGRVGTGFSGRVSHDLRRRLDGMIRKTAPFGRLAKPARKDAIFVAPELVCEVEFSAWTGGGHLRHASFKGIREDLVSEQVTMREPKQAVAPSPTRRGTGKTEIAGVRLSHPDKVLYADQGLTKSDLAEYYERVGDWILPHLAGRPLSLVRCPAGEGEQCFFQKHAGPGLSEAVRRVPIREEDGTAEYLAIDDLKGLISLVQLGVLEMHPWGSRTDDVERPDRLIFDFDPGEGVAWERVKAAAAEARQRLEDLGLASFLKTTGGKGLHVTVPVSRRQGWDEAKAFTKALAEAMAKDSPDAYVTTISKKVRTGRILIDYLRNGRGATAVAPYSTRARPGAPVAAPLDWAELDRLAGGGVFTVETLPDRLESLAEDPWAELPKIRQSITAKARRGVGLR